MTKKNPDRKHIVFLFSDTGGGHRSATEAVIEALESEYGDQVSTEMVDFFKRYAPPPLDRMPMWYPRMMRMPQAWKIGYRLSNGRRRTRLLTTTFWLYVRRFATSLIRNHPSDLIVSVHPVSSAPLLTALHRSYPPFVTIVTDLVTTHALWYHHRTTLCLVPTEEARDRGIACGLNPRQFKVVGLPVAARFCSPPCEKEQLREQLGWPRNVPMVVLIGGGDGMGPLKRTALAIASSGIKVGLAVITGRNQKLKKDLESQKWPMPTFIYGFVREMPDFMQAADILVTKAGPGTIFEAFNSGLPLILYSRLPGQEDGNVQYVVDEGAGIWAPTPELIVSALRDWTRYPKKRDQAAEAARRLARPNAARDIARELAKQAGIRKSM